MIMMNWRSAGVKVLTITLSVLFFMAIGFLFFSSIDSKQKAIDSKLLSAKQLLLVSESIRNNVSDNWKQGIVSPALLQQISLNQGATVAKATVHANLPVGSAIKALQSQSQTAGFRFKVPTTNPRNKQNAPDSIENDALSYFQSNPQAKEYSYLDEEKQELRYFKPVKMEKQCEQCHGNPASSQQLWGNINGKDILGYKMENKRAGDLHGAFEIIYPMADSFAEIQTKTYKDIAFFVILLLITAATGYISMSQVVISPLTELALKLQDISGGEGDLSARLKAKGKNEFAWVAYSFNTFVKKIAKTIDNISTTSDQLSSSSHQLAEITKMTELGVTRQLSETTQVASAMEEMTATVQEVAQNAINASSAAVTADEEAHSGKNIVSETIDAINQLASDVENAANVIHELESDSNSIGEVLSVIQGIAEQTNLLALNAAIEAARAGEQGRGFAVVADEVRTLASRTQNSTLEIQQTIERLQNRAKQAVSVMENGRKQATSSVEQAASAGKSITNISERIDTINDMNNQIAAAAAEQKVVAEEINRNINSITAVTNETSSGAKNTSEASIDLSELADKLRQTVGHFKT